MKKNKNSVIVAVSGGFDPIHAGHIRMLKEAKALGDVLVVILNNDNWLIKKKGYLFIQETERKEIIEANRYVDKVIISHHLPDTSDMSVCKELELCRPHIFANGGDRFIDNIPEVKTCQNIGCEMIFNVGEGGKIQSSSWLLKNFKQALTEYEPIVKRGWGGFTILKEMESYWVKKLYVNKGARTSLQSHNSRDEVWYVLNGDVLVEVNGISQTAKAGDVFFISKKTKHRLTGITPSCVLEIASGIVCESDIIRYEDDYKRTTSFTDFPQERAL